MLLDVRNLYVQFTSSNKATVRDVSFTIEEGKTTALVGESGSGKSITAMSIIGINPSTHTPKGEIIFQGEDLLRISDKARQQLRGNQISVIFQEPMTALNPLHTIGKQIREMITYHQEQQHLHIDDIISTLLEDVELSHLKTRLNQYPHQLSGGERQRIMIAMALANRPRLLIADEPTTALDVTTQAAIIVLLERLQKKYHMGILLITHDLHLVRSIADTIIVMKSGKVVENNTATLLFASPKHEYTKMLLSAKHKSRAVSVNNREPIILQVKDLSVSYTEKQGLSLRKKSQKIAVHPVSFDLKKGHTLGIVGESGSGKTSLGLACARLLNSSGKIIFQSHPLHSLSTKALYSIRSELQFVFQDPFSSLNPRMNVRQIVSEGYKLHHDTPNNTDAAVISILEKVGLSADMADRYPHEFSGGQRQRINIARAMILNPSCVIFDEPTSALDISLQTQIIELLKQLQSERKLTYIFISHDIASVAAISHDIIVMKKGHVIDSGKTQDIFFNPQKDYTRLLVQASGLHE